MASTQVETMTTPSQGKIVRATIIALLVAAVILITVILPAEYGVDPLGTGRALGLVDLSTTGGITVSAGDTPQLRPYKVDSRDIELEPGQGLELKYYMEQGAAMVYSWKATGRVEFEFHGEPDEKPTPDYYDSYKLENQGGQTHSYGSFTAPSTGIHGWFWENKGASPVTIHLTTAGFYESGIFYGPTGMDALQFEDAK